MGRTLGTGNGRVCGMRCGNMGQTMGGQMGKMGQGSHAWRASQAMRDVQMAKSPSPRCAQDVNSDDNA
jgi:hypothetical protein